MADSYNKKEREKKRRKRKQDKAERKKQRKTDGVKPVEFMYVDENGNLTATPPDLSARKEINAEDIEVSVPKKTERDESKFMKKGYVKFYNREKRYGFIEESLTKESYFVHADSLIDEIKDNDKVTFEIGAGPKGPVANNVQLFVEDK
ncbi:MAG: cold shock domain-containing protein [Chitinophagales bacterium]|nr:cold shock domain-containing protein [Chitinophagales bacterium]